MLVHVAGQRGIFGRSTSYAPGVCSIVFFFVKSFFLVQNDNVDLLEANPEYAKFAPPKPVVHRRTSVDWENFESDGNTAVGRLMAASDDGSRTNYSEAFAAYDGKTDNGMELLRCDFSAIFFVTYFYWVDF